MKKDKFCVSRKLVYLVLLLVLGAGLLWGVNYMNSQKMGSKPKAAGSTPNKCYYSNNCNDLAKRMNVPFWYDEIAPTAYPDLVCCRPVKRQYANSNLSITPVPTITNVIGECISKKIK